MTDQYLDLHYYLPDHKHSMDAVVRNKCEAELLGIFIEAANVLGVEVELESLAHAEGGLREIWKAIGKNSNQISILLVIITIILSRIPTINAEHEALETELTKLSIEEKKLEIKKLRLGLNDPERENKATEDAIGILNKNPKIVVRRSNFYRQLSSYPKVQSIGVSALNSNLMPIQEEHKVNRKIFNKFILNTHAIKPLIIEDAVIEIISPVLKEGNFKWKGFYENEPLSFTLTDSAFKSQVLREDITFQHGTCIECVLHVNQKLDEVGEVVIVGYSVPTVIRKFDDRQSIETDKGRSYKHEMKMRKNQDDLFK